MIDREEHKRESSWMFVAFLVGLTVLIAVVGVTVLIAAFIVAWIRSGG